MPTQCFVRKLIYYAITLLTKQSPALNFIHLNIVCLFQSHTSTDTYGMLKLSVIKFGMKVTCSKFYMDVKELVLKVHFKMKAINLKWWLHSSTKTYQNIQPLLRKQSIGWTNNMMMTNNKIKVIKDKSNVKWKLES